MIYDLCQTLEKLLREDGKLPRSDVEIAFDQPTGEWSATLGRPTINVWCFDMRENIKLRRRELDRERVDNRSSRTMIPPRRMDLSLLVTAWARKIEDEHRLLWRALRVLRAYPRIPLDRCEGGLRYQNFDLPLVTADMSEATFNITDLWSVLENQMKLGFVAVATVELEIDTDIETPLVLESEFRVRQVVDATVEEEAEPSGVVTQRGGDAVARTPDGSRNTDPDVLIVHRAEDPDEG